MPDEAPPLRPATAEQVETSLAFALRFDDGRRIHTEDHAMARITAERVVQHLDRLGYVVSHEASAGSLAESAGSDIGAARHGRSSNGRGIRSHRKNRLRSI